MYPWLLYRLGKCLYVKYRYLLHTTSLHYAYVLLYRADEPTTLTSTHYASHGLGTVCHGQTVADVPQPEGHSLQWPDNTYKTHTTFTSL